MTYTSTAHIYDIYSESLQFILQDKKLTSVKLASLTNVVTVQTEREKLIKKGAKMRMRDRWKVLGYNEINLRLLHRFKSLQMDDLFVKIYFKKFDRLRGAK